MLPSISFPKLTWNEIKQHIRRSQKDISNLQIMNLPSHFSFRPSTLFSNVSRMYYLSIPSGHHENTLMYSDIKLDLRSDVPCVFSLPLFTMPNPVNYENMSKEEELLRERKRLRSFGISTYDKVGSSFAFSAGTDLFVFNDEENSQRKIPMELCITRYGSPMDTKICPMDQNFVSYISNNDIYVTSINCNKTYRLTNTHDENKNWQDNWMSAGVPSFITQEELERFTGYWWRPCSSIDEDGIIRYTILYEEVDESKVNILYIISPSTNGASYDQYRYPRAGQCNAVSDLKLVEFFVRNGELEKVVYKNLAQPLTKYFPTMEYLLNSGWITCGMRVFVLLSNRRQQKFTLASISYDSFVDAASSPWATQQPNIAILFEESSNMWLHTNNLVHFIPTSNKDILKFIFPSENSGFMHLQLVQIDCQESQCSPVDPQTQTFKAQITNITRLTKGNWSVDSKQLWMDHERGLIYFMAFKETPLETHLYVTSYNKESEIIRLTLPDYTHNIEMDETRNYFVSLFSSLKSTSCQVFQIIHSQYSISAQPIASLFHSVLEKINMRISIELFSYKSISGHEMHGMMYKANNLDLNLRYPVLLYVYAGPYVQLVNNSDKILRNMRLQIFAELGYIVVVIDSRGSANRGSDFEGHIRLKMGTVEVADQVEGLIWLAKQHPFLDMNRVAIHGWSYGGYISLMALVQRPDIFKVAISGAPVTAWHLYDTAYTERYMDLPTTNTIGYEEGNVVKLADKFPDEDGRLLILHGMKDENVHFYHTTSLINALVKAGKPHRLQIYPNERHGIRSPEANEHCDALIIHFLQQNL